MTLNKRLSQYIASNIDHEESIIRKNGQADVNELKYQRTLVTLG